MSHLKNFARHRIKKALQLLARWGWEGLRRWEGEKTLKRVYKKLHKKTLNTKSPTTFTEKLFVRMIELNRSGNQIMTQLSDKYLAREYVKEKVGEDYLPRLIWHEVNPREIPFDQLPDKCAIKVNSGSGGNIIVNGSIDKADVASKLDRWLKENYYWVTREYQYYSIRPRIIIEEFLDDGQESGPLDYRFFCFYGVPHIIQVDNHAHDINPFYDTEWNKLDLSYRKKFKDVDIRKPSNLEQMLQLASVLSKDFDFVRVDLYSVHGRTVVGEMTFTPVAGRFVFTPNSWDAELGKKWLRMN